MNTENESTFLDIGSGFGKPVFHAAMQTGCPSIGVEIVPARVSFCQDQKYSMQDYYTKQAKENEMKPPKMSRKSSIVSEKSNKEPKEMNNKLKLTLCGKM